MKAKAPIIALAALAAFLAAAVLVYVSRARPTEAAFTAMLSQADALAESDESKKALSLLKRARKSASSSTNWLSIAKREIALSDFVAAEESLMQALELFPANDRLSAALVYLFVRQGRLDAAAPFIPFLAGTEFAPLAAYAEIALDAQGFPLGEEEEGNAANPQAYAEAWRATGNPAFRRDAAVLYALSGNYASGFSLYAEKAVPSQKTREDLAGERLFSALLAYDARAFSAVPELLGIGEAVEGFSEEEALLAADAFFIEGKEDAAALIWKGLFESGAAETPILFLNHALTASSWAEKRAALEKSLELFPDYYPALALYARSALEADAPENYFPFYGAGFSAKALSETLHVSQGMEEAYRNRPPSLPEAREALDAALRLSANDSDRLKIELERVRFFCFKEGKDAEARGILWNILEENSGEALAHEFALWFFATQGDFGIFLELAEKFEDASPIYKGVAAAARGSLDEALQCFSLAAGPSGEWEILANRAVILKKQGAYNDSADLFALAAEAAKSDATKSRLYFNAAEIFALQKANVRAADMLRHAVSLDPGNYSAKTMLRRMESELGL